ncbi:hypothetical protein [Candidatus Nitrospira salsa]
MTSHTASVCKTNFLTVFTLFLVAVLSSLPLHGQAASLTLTWEPNNENDLAGYRIYKRIPPSTNYGAPAFSGFPSNPVAPSQTIGGLTDETRYSFIATAIDVAGNESAPSNEVSGTTTGSTTPPPPPPPAPGPPPPPPPPGGSVVSINFQPASASTPTGFLKDDGAPFNASRGYGWSTRVNTRERNQSSNQSLDTLIHFDQGTNVTWQYTLPNGQYHISLASGDPTYHQGPHHVQVEGITVINNVSTQANKFVTVTNRLVTVSDGQLTIRLTRSGGSSKTLLNFVRIASTGSNPPPPAPGPPPPPPPSGGSVVSINFQPASASTPAGFLKDDGAPFNASRGYGWSTRVNTRERNRSSNQSLDTLIHFDQGTNVTWQYTLPNGQYHISLASGDPTYHQGPHHVQVEGITVINNVSTQANKFATVTNRLVTVSDGQLTIRLTRSGGSSKTLLNFVRIAPQ